MVQKVIRRTKRVGAREMSVILGNGARFFVSKYLLRRRYFTRRIHGYRMHLDVNDPGISRAIAITGTREQQLKYLLDRRVKPGDVVLDVGANIGYYTAMLATKVGPTGHVYAIEPEPRNFDLLKRNVALNNLEHVVDTFQMGASDKAGVEKLYVQARSNLHSFVGPNAEHPAEGATGQWVDVPVVDLSSFIEGKRPINLLRMDIEGYEVEVLNGLEQAIVEGRFAGDIVFECHRPRYDATRDITKPLRMLHRNGYRARYLTSNDERNGRVSSLGYQPSHRVMTNDTRWSGIYENIAEDDVVRLISELGGVRDVLFSREP